MVDVKFCDRDLKVGMDTMADVNIIAATLYMSVRPHLERLGLHLEAFPLQVGPFSPNQPGEEVLGVIKDVPIEINGIVFFLEFTVLPCKQPILLGAPFHDRHVVNLDFVDRTYSISPAPKDGGREPQGVFTVPATIQKWLMGPNGQVLDSITYVGSEAV